MHKRNLLFSVLFIGSTLLPCLAGWAQTNPATLKDAAAAKGILYGTAESIEKLSSDAPYQTAINRESDLMVASGDLLMAYCRPTPTTWDFTKGDQLLQYARDHNQVFYGTHLVWHGALPDHWFPQYVTAGNAKQVMVDHINAMCNHYKGNMYGWSVVNEAVEYYDDGGWQLRRSPWLAYIGPSYIEEAFRAARAADPNALLVYNDYGVEDDWYAPNVGKRARILALLRDLKAKNIPVDALGIQAHIWAGNRFSKNSGFRQFLRDVAALGLKILITELDVAEGGYTPSPAGLDQDIAEAYRTFLEVVLDEPAVVSVVNWGLSDKYSWYANSRPLPLDVNFNKKPAYYAMLNAFNGSSRTGFGGVYKLTSKVSVGGTPLRVLDAQYGRDANGTNVQLYKDNGSNAQRWAIQSTGDGFYQITVQVGSKARVLDADNRNGVVKGSNVQLWQNFDQPNQRWRITPVGKEDYTLTPKASYVNVSQRIKLRLDVAGAVNGDEANVQLWEDHGGDNQRWRIESVPASARLASAEVEATPVIQMHPNPARESVTLTVDSKQAQPLVIALFNGQGVKVTQWKKAVGAGSQQAQLSLQPVSKGLYLLRFTLDGQQHVRKLVVE